MRNRTPAVDSEDKPTTILCDNLKEFPRENRD
jgi:hypothetical protein